jgi:MFS family permease
VVISGLIADRFGRRNTLGALAVLIALFSASVPELMNGGEFGQNLFVLLGFGLLGLSYGQAAGAVTANFEPHFRYTGATLTSDLAWLVGAAFAPLVALGLSANFGLAYVSLYLLSGAGGGRAARSLNRAAKRMVSRTVSSGSRLSSCVTNPHSRRSCAREVTAWPLSDTVPGLAISDPVPRPDRMRSSVDLPAPLGPTTARMLELEAVKDTDFSNPSPLPPTSVAGEMEKQEGKKDGRMEERRRGAGQERLLTARV